MATRTRKPQARKVHVPADAPRAAHSIVGVVDPHTGRAFTVLAASPERKTAIAQAIDAARKGNEHADIASLPAGRELHVAWCREMHAGTHTVGMNGAHLPVITGPGEVIAQRDLPGRIA